MNNQDYGKATGTELEVLKNINTFPKFQTRDTFISCLKKGLDIYDALNQTEIRSRALVNAGKDCGQQNWQTFWEFRREVKNFVENTIFSWY